MTGYADLAVATYDEIATLDPYVHKSAVSMSMLGRCRRQAAYALHQGWPPHNEAGSPQAYLGSAIHKDLLPEMAKRLGGEHEVPLTLSLHGVDVTGTADLVLDSAILDLKTVSQYYYAVVSEKIPFSHRLQVTGYAAALGRSHCTLLYVNRSDGSRFAETWGVDEYWPEVDQWIADISLRPEDTPRDERGPGHSMVCDSCPFAEQCWGPVTDGQLPQGVIVTEYGVELALESYAEARERAKKAKADQEYWRDVLAGQDPGPYGGWELGWSNPRSKEVFDAVEAERVIREMGLTVPMRTTQGKPSISVAPHREDNA